MQKCNICHKLIYSHLLGSGWWLDGPPTRYIDGTTNYCEGHGDDIVEMRALLDKLRHDPDGNIVKPMQGKDQTMENYNLKHNPINTSIEEDDTWYEQRIRILRTAANDWMGLYVNEVLVREGKSLDVASTLVEIISRSIDVQECRVKDSYLDDYGDHCPETWPMQLEQELKKNKTPTSQL